MTAGPARKIVHMTSVHRPLDVRIFTRECASLAARGHDVILVAVHDRDEQRDGVQIRAIARPKSLLHRMTVTAFRVFREARRQRADVYQIHDAELLPWALLLRWMGGVVIYDMHENVPKDLGDKTWLPNWCKPMTVWCVRLAERVFLARMPVVFAESSYAQDYPWVRRREVVLNMPSLEHLPSPSASRHAEPCVTYIGGVAADRGSTITIRALAELKRRGVNVGWHCVGPCWPPEHQAELQQAADDHGLRIDFHGYLPGNEGWSVVRDCHIGLAVLDPRPNFVDSFPSKIFEYMALEMPVIASDFPLYRQVVEEARCGICVDPESAESLADAIQSLIEDPDLARRMGKAGRQAVEERYNWSVELHKLERFYEQLLQP